MRREAAQGQMGAETQRVQGSLDPPHSPGGADRSPWPCQGLTQLPQDSVLGAPKGWGQGPPAHALPGLPHSTRGQEELDMRFAGNRISRGPPIPCWRDHLTRLCTPWGWGAHIRGAVRAEKEPWAGRGVGSWSSGRHSLAGSPRQGLLPALISPSQELEAWTGWSLIPVALISFPGWGCP